MNKKEIVLFVILMGIGISLIVFGYTYEINSM